MKKAGAILIITIVIGVIAGSAFSEEMAKEGSQKGKNYFTGTSKVLAMGQEYLQMNYEGSGVSVNDSGKGFMHLAAIYAIGAIQAVNGVFEETGFMVMTATDGDKTYATYNVSGTFGKPANGTWTWVGGTGKYAGIEGSGEFTRYALQNATEGVFTSTSVTKGNYKLP
jgi:hypothetical protein